MVNQLSIIIPTLNEATFLPRVLDSIVKQHFSGQLQVIVVDGGSTDGTIKIAETYKSQLPGLEIIKLVKRGIGLARNVGADHAKYQHLLFIDSDIFFPDNFLNRFLTKIDPAVKYRVDFILHLPLYLNLLDYLWIAFGYLCVSISRIWDPICIGTFLFTTKANHQRVKGFNENIKLGEDIDYGRRSIAKGAKYSLHYRPYVLAHPRRIREMGRLKTLIVWARAYFHAAKYGPVYDNAVYSYHFGQHQKFK